MRGYFRKLINVSNMIFLHAQKHIMQKTYLTELAFKPNGIDDFSFSRLCRTYEVIQVQQNSSSTNTRT